MATRHTDEYGCKLFEASDEYGRYGTSLSEFGRYLIITAGGTIFNESLSDSVALGDSAAVQLTFQPTVTDSVAMGDSPSGQILFYVELADSLTLDELCSITFGVIFVLRIKPLCPYLVTPIPRDPYVIVLKPIHPYQVQIAPPEDE